MHQKAYSARWYYISWCSVRFAAATVVYESLFVVNAEDNWAPHVLGELIVVSKKASGLGDEPEN